MDSWTLWRKLQRGDNRLGPSFLGVFACNRLPKTGRRPAGMVANLDPAGKPGSHWVAILLLPGGRGEYFDSYGYPPMKTPLLTYMDDECPRGWLFNDQPVQAVLSTACGHFCIVFLALRHHGLPMSDIVDLFDPHDLTGNDRRVYRYVSLYHA